MRAIVSKRVCHRERGRREIWIEREGASERESRGVERERGEGEMDREGEKEIKLLLLWRIFITPVMPH